MLKYLWNTVKDERVCCIGYFKIKIKPKATPHNDRLVALRAACLHIFCHLTQVLLEIRQYSCVEFMQADEKFYCAIHTQSLCGVALIFIKEIKTLNTSLDAINFGSGDIVWIQL